MWTWGKMRVSWDDFHPKESQSSPASAKLQDAAHTYPSGGTMHSHQQTFSILYATSCCLQVIRNQNTHWPLSHRGQPAVITSTSSAGTGLCAAFLRVPRVGEARGYNSGLYFTTQDMQELWASSCHSRAEFLPLGILAFPDLKRKFFLATANSCLGKGERKHETVPLSCGCFTKITIFIISSHSTLTL